MSIDYLEEAKHQLKDYDRRIPREVLHSIHSTHKVSHGWFQHVGGLFCLANTEGIIDTSYQKRFFDYIEKSEFHNRLTKRKDIRSTERLLKKFIRELS
jgi:hypothetical protein